MIPYRFENTRTSLDQLDGFRVEFDAETARADIILDRPPFNIVSVPERDQLRAVFEALDRDPVVRVVVLRGAGKDFSSGGHIAGFLEASPEHLSDLANNIAAPERCSKPVIAMIRGYCFGVGFEVSLACDFRVAADSAAFALPEMRLGMIPGSGGSARLLRMIGITRTKNMTMRGKRITAQEAYGWGILTECVPDADLEATTAMLVAELCALSPLAQRTIKRVLNRGQNLSVAGAIELEGEAYGRLRSSDDFQEGVAAFHDKRKPKFRGT